MDYEKILEELMDNCSFDPNVDYYREARDSYLSARFGTPVPSLQHAPLRISFRINNAKNAPLVYAILDAIPSEFKQIESNDVVLEFPGEQQVVDSFRQVIDLAAVVRNWKTFTVGCNGVNLDWRGFQYILDVICDNCGKNAPQFSYLTPTALRKRYLGGKSKTPKPTLFEKFGQVVIPSDLASIPIAVAARYREVYLTGLEVKTIDYRPYEVILVVEDSLIVNFFLTAWTDTGACEVTERSMGKHISTDDVFRCHIRELTENKFFRFNRAEFSKTIVLPHRVWLDSRLFGGIASYPDVYQRAVAIDYAYPELKIRERLDAMPGTTCHYVIFEIESASGETVMGYGWTTNKVHTYVLKICKEFETMNSRTVAKWGIKDSHSHFSREFCSAFLSWEGKKKRWRLENKMSYFYVDGTVKSEFEASSAAEKVFLDACNGLYSDIERGTYSKPVNRWKSEELVYKTAKSIYGDYQVVYQFSPIFLGAMSYDVYICGLKVAIEYQGIQHFQPVDYFGGEENHKRQVERDKLKKELSDTNGVHLVYVNYWEDIMPTLIRSKVEEALGAV